MEIDLLRAGPHVLTYPRTLRDRLPRFPIPLHGGDLDVGLDLQAAFDQTYLDGRYAQQVDYSRPCEPPLSAEDRAWADELIAAWQDGK